LEEERWRGEEGRGGARRGPWMALDGLGWPYVWPCNLVRPTRTVLRRVRAKSWQGLGQTMGAQRTNGRPPKLEAALAGSIPRLWSLNPRNSAPDRPCTSAPLLILSTHSPFPSTFLRTPPPPRSIARYISRWIQTGKLATGLDPASFFHAIPIEHRARATACLQNPPSQ
jgi:hypothetical protein